MESHLISTQKPRPALMVRCPSTSHTCIAELTRLWHCCTGTAALALGEETAGLSSEFPNSFLGTTQQLPRHDPTASALLPAPPRHDRAHRPLLHCSSHHPSSHSTGALLVVTLLLLLVVTLLLLLTVTPFRCFCWVVTARGR